MPTRASVVCLALLAASVGCSSAAAPALPSTALASPMSRFCAASNPCPGITKKKLEVCGECDPATRYYRRAICSLDSKVRTAVDSCVQGKASVRISGKALFGSRVQGCVRQRLSNDPVVLRRFVAVAQRHEAKADEQRAWRRNCEQRWAAYRRKRLAGKAGSGGSGVGSLRLTSKPRYAYVWVDGKRHDRPTPPRGYLVLADLAAGEHELRLRYADSHELVRRVVVAANQAKTYRLVLERLPKCASDADCKGHRSGPFCHAKLGRCSCRSASDCKSPNSICKPFSLGAPYRWCQQGLVGSYCSEAAHCKQKRCARRSASSITGRCAPKR